jgi:hypothetical protein
VWLFLCRWCDEWVQMAYRGDQMVLTRNWLKIVHKYNDTVEFTISLWSLFG